MKRKYVSPKIAVEHYELTQAIATCDLKIGFLDSECVKKDPDSTRSMIRLASIGGFVSGTCDIPANDESKEDGWAGVGMSPEDGLCYHTSMRAAFNS